MSQNTKDVSPEASLTRGGGLTAEAITAGYGAKTVVEVPHLGFAPGTITAIVGPNGSGKSTLLRSLAGTLPIRSGTITVNGRNLTRLSAREAARLLAFVPQDAAFPFAFTVRELIRLGIDAGGAAGELTQEREETALDLFELRHLAGRGLTALSGGERQRAALARAFAQATPCLLLDEPTAHLDLRYQDILRTALRQFAHQEGRTVILVLHDLNFAASFADRVILLKEGRIVAQDTPGAAFSIANLERVYRTEVRILRHAETGAFWIQTGTELRGNTGVSRETLFEPT